MDVTSSSSSSNSLHIENAAFKQGSNSPCLINGIGLLNTKKAVQSEDYNKISRFGNGQCYYVAIH